LDKEVSGILLFAKSEKIMDWLKDHWKQTEKIYLALVEGKPKEMQGTISGWLKEGARQKVYTTSSEEGAKYAVTHYRIVQELPSHTLLEVQIETGRKNQIRVHLSDLGCPIVGDYKYGASAHPLRRVRLHACSFTFPHPQTGEMMHIESTMPKDFLVLKNEDENYKK
jgi:23S rRNA-/tRNA-specific pseudouridylate synthase